MSNNSTTIKNRHGNFCFCCKFGAIEHINKEYFLEEMIRNFSLVSNEEPSDAQCRAWISCQKVLAKTISSLPSSYKNTWIVLEYVLPNHKPGTKKYTTENGIRPDVLIIGKEFVSVLEFKQRKLDNDGSVFEGYISQAQKYVRRLEKYHSESINKYIAPIVVLTLEKNLFDSTENGCTICSSDKLSDALIFQHGEKPDGVSHAEIVKWLSDNK